MQTQYSQFAWILLALLLIGAAAEASAQQHISGSAGSKSNPGESDELQGIVARLEQAQAQNREHYRPYTMTREYLFYAGQDSRPNAQVLADVSFVPPDRKTFRIEKAEGSERGVSIVRRILEREAQLASSSKGRSTLSEENYDFKLLGSGMLNGQACWIVGLRAKREDRDLINGKVWVDRSTYLVRRAEGDMAKTPSWWVKKVHITMDFGELSGMWLQISTFAVADLHLFGRHSFTEQALGIQTGVPVAQNPATADTPQPLAKPESSSVQQTALKHRRPESPLHPLVGAGILSK